MTPQERRELALEKRMEAAEVAYWRRPQPLTHLTNGDEYIPLKPMSFTKGLPHNIETGLIKDQSDFDAFVKGIDSGDPVNFKATPLGPVSDISNPSIEPTAGDWESDRAKNNSDKKPEKVRAWESAGAGLTFDLQGMDAQAVTMPPAPALGSDELTAEIAEVYAQALLRDIPFSEYFLPEANNTDVNNVLNTLNKLSFFNDGKRNGYPLNRYNAFRGFTPGDMEGPYLSQFLLTGTNGLNTKGSNSPEFMASQGQIAYGSQTIDQKVRLAIKEEDYLINWKEWIDAQNGADFRGQEAYNGNNRRFITTPRDLATYVHYDALYQAYLNACIILLGTDVPEGVDKYDEGVPFQDPDYDDHQQGFAHYGGPHILTLVTEVATRALKAVRYQKFNTHRRLRPEALAARMHKLTNVINELNKKAADPKAQKAANDLQKMFEDLQQAGIFELIAEKNPKEDEKANYLLPMAFVEGSPMHPTYGAGHATVAGACVTILKAFFNHKLFIRIPKNGESFSLTNDKTSSEYAFISMGGEKLESIKTVPLTLEGELNKLAANISIGRDWAGVHYYSDYVESMKLGEKIAIAMLEEQALMYNPLENFYLTLPKFDGTTVRIDQTGVTQID